MRHNTMRLGTRNWVPIHHLKIRIRENQDLCPQKEVKNDKQGMNSAFSACLLKILFINIHVVFTKENNYT